MRFPQKVYLGIGSNLGDPLEFCKQAVGRLSEVEGLSIVKVSSFYLTSPYGFVDQNDFVNCAVCALCSIKPRDLLHEINRIEASLGRKRDLRWGPRTVDIDILLFGDEVINEEGLIIPHPELHKRRFAIIPLLEIERDLVHPVFKRRLKHFLREIDRTQRVKLLSRFNREAFDKGSGRI